MLLKSFSFFFALIAIVGFPTNVVAQEQLGCTYFENMIKNKKKALEEQFQSKDYEHKYAYGYAFEEINQCLNPHLYTPGNEEPVDNERTSKGFFDSIWDRLPGLPTSKDAQNNSLQVLPEEKYSNDCGWAARTTEAQPEQLYVVTQAIHCALSRSNFSWPNDIDWLVAPRLLKALEDAKKQSRAVKEICRLKGALYQYRFWRDPYIKGKEHYKGIGYQIREALMQNEDFSCLNSKDKISIGEDRDSILVPKQTPDYEKNKKLYALHTINDEKNQLIEKVSLNLTLSPVRNKKEEKVDYRAEPTSDTNLIEIKKIDASSIDKSTYYFTIKYTNNTDHILLNTCANFSHNRLEKNLYANSNNCHSPESYILSRYNNKKIKTKVTRSTEETLKTEIIIPKEMQLKRGFDYLNPVDFSIKTCIDNKKNSTVKSNPRLFYYATSAHDKIGLVDYMRLQDAYREVVQSNIYYCMKGS